MVTPAVTVPLYGKLSAVYGRKPSLLMGLGVLIAGSGFSGQAHGTPPGRGPGWTKGGPLILKGPRPRFAGVTGLFGF